MGHPGWKENGQDLTLWRCGALGDHFQIYGSCLRRAVRAVELCRDLQMRSCKPDPLGADIVHVREDRRNGAGLAVRSGSPGGRVKMFDKNLVDAGHWRQRSGLRLGRVECEP